MSTKIALPIQTSHRTDRSTPLMRPRNVIFAFGAALRKLKLLVAKAEAAMSTDPDHCQENKVHPNPAPAPPPSPAAPPKPLAPTGIKATLNSYFIQSYTELILGQNRAGLESADCALQLATEASKNPDTEYLHKHISRAHFYRAVALENMQRWEEASAAYTRAAGIWDVDGFVSRRKAECDAMVQKKRKEKQPDRCHEEKGKGDG